MLRLARSCHIVASFAFVVIGGLHIVTHLLALTGGELESGLRAMPDVDVFGAPAAVWDLWQAQSLLMGVFCLALGLSNLGALFAQPKGSYPAEVACLTGVFALVVVFGMGLLYLGPIQIIGAPIGIMLFLIAAIASRGRERGV